MEADNRAGEKKKTPVWNVSIWGTLEEIYT